MTREPADNAAGAKETEREAHTESSAGTPAGATQAPDASVSLDDYIERKLDELNDGLLFSPEWMGSVLSTVAPPGADWFPTTKAQIFTIDGFLSAGECHRIIELCTPHLRRSTTTMGVHRGRTSRTTNMRAMESDEGIRATLDLDIKICNAMNIHPLYSEDTQFHYYRGGEYFKPHTDFFEPGTEEYEEYATLLGQRTWTFMIYLNEPAEGGETEFVNIPQGRIACRTGTALAWNNLDKAGFVNRDTLHQGVVVSQGYKAVVTKWFRDKRAI